jgi:hypothetical protein
VSLEYPLHIFLGGTDPQVVEDNIGVVVCKLGRVDDLQSFSDGIRWGVVGNNVLNIFEDLLN